MRKLKKMLAFMVIAVMALSMAACGSSNNQQATTTAASSSEAATTVAETSKAPDLTPITLTAFVGQQDIDQAGIANTPVMEEITKKTGVTIDWITGDAEKFKVLFASGSLPDLIEFEASDESNVRDAIKSNMIRPLDDLIAQYGQNIQKRIPYALKWSQTMYGEGKTYFLTTGTNMNGENPRPNYNGYTGFYTRFDIYQAIGSPEFKGMDEYLEVLKKMQEYARTQYNDKKIYSVSGFYDWGFWTWPYQMASFGDSSFNSVGSTNYYTGEDVPNSDPNSALWKALAWYNKAYREGILDPESFIMKWDQYSAKVGNGTCLTSPISWLTVDPAIVTDPNAGFYLLPGMDNVNYLYKADNPLGNRVGLANAINSKCTTPERAMQFLDYLASDEGSRLHQNGIKGVDWDVVDGKPMIIGARLEAFKAKTGSEYDTRQGIKASYLDKYRPGNFTCDDGYPIDLKGTDISSVERGTADINFINAYDSNKEGLLFPGDVYVKWVKEGKTKAPTEIFLYKGFAPAMDEEIGKTWGKIDKYFNDNLASIIMAKDDAAFEAAKKKTIDTYIQFGIEKLFAESMRLQEEGKKIYDSLGSYK